MKKLITLIFLFSVAYGQRPMFHAHNQAVTGIIYDTDAQAFFTATGITDATQKNAVNQLVLDLKSASIWTKFKFIYPFVGGTATTHKFNLKDPRDLDAAFRLTFPNGATHSATGVDWDGTTQYAETFLTPSTSLLLNSTHISYSSREDLAGGEEMGVADNGSDNQIMIVINAGGGRTGYFRNNSSGFSSAVINDATGLFINSRISSSGFELYRNGTNILSAAVVSQGLASTRTLNIGRNNYNNPSYATRKCDFATAGDGLTAAEALSLSNAVAAYKTTLGR